MPKWIADGHFARDERGRIMVYCEGNARTAGARVKMIVQAANHHHALVYAMDELLRFVREQGVNRHTPEVKSARDIMISAKGDRLR